MTHQYFQQNIDELSRECQNLLLSMHEFQLVIDREEKAIAKSDINELELISADKTLFGRAIQMNGDRIKQLIESLWQHIHFDESPNRTAQLNDLMEYLSIQEKLSEWPPNIMLSIASLRQWVDQLSHERSRIFPKIESNAYLVKKLLQYHRQTYAFWQAVAGESEAVYGKTGRAVSTSKKSILTVRT